MEQHLKYARTVGDRDRDTDTDAHATEAGAKVYAVLAVFVHPDEASTSLDRLLESARRCEDPWGVHGVALDARLPTCTESYRYLGSTTTCPCTTGVRSTVLTHPVQASAAALEPARCGRSATGASPVTATAGGDPPAGTYGSRRGSATTSSSRFPPP